MSIAELNAMLDDEQPDAPMDGWGRRLIVPEGGGKAKAYTRATTFIKAITADGGDGLITFHGRFVAKGLVDDPSLMQFVLDGDPDDPDTKKEWNRRLDDAAHRAGKNRKRDQGTLIHEACARWLAGRPVVSHPDTAGPLAEFQRLVAAHDVTVVACEQIIVNERWGVSGRFDLVVRFGDDPTLYIADIKTGDVKYGANGFAPQLYIYATAETIYDATTERHQPMLDVSKERGLIFEIPRDGSQGALHWVSYDGAEEMLELAAVKRAWPRKAKAGMKPVEAPTTTPSRHQWALDRLAQVAAEHGIERVRREWDDHVGPAVPTPKQLAGVEWTDEQIDAIARYCDVVEAVKEMPFGTTDPEVLVVEPQPEPEPRFRLPRPDDTDSEVVDAETYEALHAACRRDEATMSVLAEWAHQAKSASLHFLPNQVKPYRRQVDLTIAALHLIDRFYDFTDDSDDVVREALHVVVGEDYVLQPALTVGALIGALNATQAQQLAQLAIHATLRIDGTGAPRFVMSNTPTTDTESR